MPGRPSRRAARPRRSQALGIACIRPKIGVDVHLHRITNRWGSVQTTTQGQTTVAPERVLPERHRVPINALLVPVGTHVRAGVAPRCSTCPVPAMCRPVGVASHRSRAPTSSPTDR